MKEKTADEMFEELGCQIDRDEYRTVVYKTNRAGSMIYLCVFYNTNDERFRLKIYEQYMNIKLLQAINKKVEEFGGGYNDDTRGYR